MREKPRVKFDMSQPYNIYSGAPAYVYPISHPSQFVPDDESVQTSTVLSVHVFNAGIHFVTRNTIYEGVVCPLKALE